MLIFHLLTVLDPEKNLYKTHLKFYTPTEGELYQPGLNLV